MITAILLLYLSLIFHTAGRLLFPQGKAFHQTGLGLSAFIILWSLLDLLKLAYPQILLCTTVPFIFYIQKDPLVKLKNHPYTIAICSVILIGVSLLNFKEWDDLTAYFPILEQIKAIGNAYEPLSLRRGLSWGGQFPLQALTTFFDPNKIYAYNIWFAILICALWCAPKTKKENLLFLGYTVAILGTTVNSAPHTLLALLLLCILQENTNLNKAILLAALCLLRIQCLAFVGVLFLFEIKDWKPTLKWGLLTILLLVPAMLEHWKQFQTPLPLLNPGTIAPEFLNLHTKPLLGGILFLKFLWSIFPCFLFFRKKTLKTNLLFASASILISLTVMDLGNTYMLRYSYPFLLAIVLYSCQTFKNSQVYSPLLLCYFIWIFIPTTLNQIENKEKFIPVNIPNLKEIQEKTQVGETIGYLSYIQCKLDHKRNRILNLDLPPSIGNYPKTENLQDWENWGKKHGIRYLLLPTRYGWAETKVYQCCQTGKCPHMKIAHKSAPLAIQPPCVHYDKIWKPQLSRMHEIFDLLEENTNHDAAPGFFLLDLQNLKENPSKS